MDNLSTELINGYKKWIAIVQAQLDIVQAEITDESFEMLSKLEMEKSAVKLDVMEQSEQSDLFEARVKEQQKQYIEKLQLLNSKVQPLLESWYSNASVDMKQVSTHRRILNSYGGTQSSDFISYYVDSKK